MGQTVATCDHEVSGDGGGSPGVGHGGGGGAVLWWGEL